MYFNSISFLVFFPIVVLFYYMIPEKLKNCWLLAAGIYFYMCWGVPYLLLLIFSILISYLGGRVIASCKEKPKYKKAVFLLCLVVLLGELIYFKYAVFIFNNLSVFLKLPDMQLPCLSHDIMLPIGISFYIFQIISYLVDIYRKEISCEKNIFRYALFIVFFPKLSSGPIVKARHFLTQLDKPHPFNEKKVQSGLLLMLLGFFEKLVIADTASKVVVTVFENYKNMNSIYLLIGAVTYAVYIYCDFGGYSHIAIGAAKVMGFELMDNFMQPYFAVSIKDFWHRWHISLSYWFRDYLYIPLGGNRCGTKRKYLNLLIVFTVSGLWHGAGWHYVVWGALHGLYQIAEDMGKRIFPKRNRMPMGYMKLQIIDILRNIVFRIKTFILVSIAWIFFGSPSLRVGLDYVWHMCTQWGGGTGSINIAELGLAPVQAGYFILSILGLFLVEIFREINRPIGQWIVRSKTAVRWGICLFVSIFIILVTFREFGQGVSGFVYFQF